MSGTVLVVSWGLAIAAIVMGCLLWYFGTRSGGRNREKFQWLGGIITTLGIGLSVFLLIWQASM